MLPYASYLRVYEPARSLSHDLRSSLHASRATLVESLTTVTTEQRAALRRAVTGAAFNIEPDDSADVYVLRREGRLHLCPVDLALRSWLALTEFLGNRFDPGLRLLMPPDALAVADDRFLQWRRDHPRAVPHIHQGGWEVPRIWFVLVMDEERELYDGGGFASLRYRTRIADARRRAASASRALRGLVTDVHLLDSLSALRFWLDNFDDESWVEVDYAGLARLLGANLCRDHSARDICSSLKALRDGDLGAAAAAYRPFQQRWEEIAAYGRAN